MRRREWRLLGVGRRRLAHSRRWVMVDDASRAASPWSHARMAVERTAASASLYDGVVQFTGFASALVLAVTKPGPVLLLRSRACMGDSAACGQRRSDLSASADATATPQGRRFVNVDVGDGGSAARWATSGAVTRSGAGRLPLGVGVGCGGTRRLLRAWGPAAVHTRERSSRGVSESLNGAMQAIHAGALGTLRRRSRRALPHTVCRAPQTIGGPGAYLVPRWRALRWDATP